MMDRFIKGLIIFLPLVFIGCNRDQYFLTDPQGNTYNAVQIGSQIWTTENLKYVIEKNSYCYHDNEMECDTMGRLYTYEGAIAADREIEGWHLPTRDDWETLIVYCGVDSIGYERLLSKEIGFSPQWAGVRLASGKFTAKGMNVVNYWSSTRCDTSENLAFSVAIMHDPELISPHNYPTANACSVRLVKDKN